MEKFQKSGSIDRTYSSLAVPMLHACWAGHMAQVSPAYLSARSRTARLCPGADGRDETCEIRSDSEGPETPSGRRSEQVSVSECFSLTFPQVSRTFHHVGAVSQPKHCVFFVCFESYLSFSFFLMPGSEVKPRYPIISP